MAIGGLAVSPQRASEISKELARLKQARKVPLHSEVKWNKAKSKEAICGDYIDLLFREIEAGHLHFHVRFSPFNLYDHRASGERKQTDTISKAYYQLLLHRAGRFYGRSRKVLVRPDDGECTAYLPRILNGLNADIGVKYNIPHQAISEIAPANSKNDALLQLLDVSLGALTSARNGAHLSGELSAIKQRLVSFALERSGTKAIDASHRSEERKFNLWSATPKWKKSAAPTR